MKLTKAIEILLPNSKTWGHGRRTDYQDAIKLGIEAMIFLKSLRDNYKPNGFKPLPGETED